MTSNSPRPTILKLSVKAGLALGILRGFWIMVEHLAGIRTDYLESVELSYGAASIVYLVLTKLSPTSQN